MRRGYGGCWRDLAVLLYKEIETLAFGNFQRLLADYPADTLHETIPDFHNTVKRFANFKKAVEEDACGRAADVQNAARALFR